LRTAESPDALPLSKTKSGPLRRGSSTYLEGYIMEVILVAAAAHSEYSILTNG
jgi:hypothetical protein